MSEGKVRETLVAFESGHYKKITGEWKGDSVWCHFKKDSGGMVHINKDKVEYMESFGEPEEFNAHLSDYPNPLSDPAFVPITGTGGYHGRKE